MKLSTALLLALPFCMGYHASAHLTYPGARDFGPISDAGFAPISISTQNTKNFGWADGTDADWAKQDDQRYFKLTLQTTTTFTFTVTANSSSFFLPAFSIYSGLGHAAFGFNADNDSTSPYTAAYLASLGAPQPRNGAFDALHTFQIGNDDNTMTGYVGGLVTLTYVGNAADGTSANYGLADGINGDGLADGTVSATFTLAAGAYTIAVGGATYLSPADEALAVNQQARGFTATIAVPEPSSVVLVVGGLIAYASLRPRRAVRVTV